jgi:transcriptional regulator with XRE-family HTH domain
VAPPHIGARIAQARKAAGWTQAQLSQRTHFSVQLVSAVEQGRKPASPAFTTAAAGALQADLQWLLGQDRVHRQHDPEQPASGHGRLG